MAGNYLKQSRHGSVLYFRRRVPDDLRACIGKPYLTKTLGTGTRRDAIILAREYAVRTDNLFRHIRTMSKDDQTPGTTRINYDFSFDLKDLFLEVKNAKPEDREAIDSNIATALKNLPVGVQAGLVATRSQKPRSERTIMEVWESFKAVQIAKGTQDDMRGGWKNPGRVDVEQLPHIRSFVEFVGGDRPIAEVTASQVIAFREHVMTTADIGSAGGRKTRLNRTGAAFKYAKSKLEIDDDFAEYFKFTGQIKKNPYQKFERDDLVALFESEAYRECSFATPSEYWLPVLGLFTGARLNELCQLLKSDIRRHEGIDTILINDAEENKRLKTDNSRRIVPIHSSLIELGFLDFVRSVPDGRIFPHLREDPLKPGDFGQKASEDFREYRRSVGVGNQVGDGKSRKAFHSFRSTFIDAMRKAKPPVPKDRRTRLVGHDYDDTHDDTYNGGDVLTMFSTDTLKSDVESVQYDVRFSPYRMA